MKFSYYYKLHKNNKTVHIFDFILKNIIHILDKYLKVVRYYELYTKNHKRSSKLFIFNILLHNLI